MIYTGWINDKVSNSNNTYCNNTNMMTNLNKIIIMYIFILDLVFYTS